MRLLVMAAVICGFVFLAGVAKAEDISELKEQLKALQETTNALNAKIQALEVKQESQAQEIKKVPELTRKLNDLKESPLGQLGEGLTIGGHMKMVLLDRTTGERNGVKQHNNLSGGFWGRHNWYFYISKQINDWLSVDIEPEIDGRASATPGVGEDIHTDTTNTLEWLIIQAYMTAYLPGEYELKVGKFNPMFSESYAKELFFHDIMNIKPGLCSLIAWHDFGAELYKNFDFEQFSLPLYLAVTNGVYKTEIDNNENKMVWLHVGPEFFQSKLKLLGSIGYGTQLTDKNKYGQLFALGGLEWKYKDLSVLTEFIYRNYRNVVITGTTRADGKREGFYIRGKYNFTPKWTGVLQFVLADLYKTGAWAGNTMRSDLYKIGTMGLNFNLTPASTIMLSYEIGSGHRSDGSEKIKWGRTNLGWRTTF